MAHPFNRTEEWHAQRRTGIGGSDAPAAVGVDPRRTPLDLYHEKLGDVAPLEPTERMLWGILHEPTIIHEYARRTGRAVYQLGMLRHPTYKWMIGNIDGWSDDEHSRRLLEVKCAATSLGWGDEGTDLIPQPYLVQVHHYLVVADVPVADVAVLIGGNELRIYCVERDEDIEGAIVEKEHAFWQHVLDHVEPDPVNVEDAVQRWGRLGNANPVPAGEEEAAAIELLRQIRTTKAELEVEEEKAKLKIMKHLADRGDTLTDLAGNALATWKLDSGRVGYTVEGRPPSRQFRLKD